MREFNLIGAMSNFVGKTELLGVNHFRKLLFLIHGSLQSRDKRACKHACTDSLRVRGYRLKERASWRQVGVT